MNIDICKKCPNYPEYIVSIYYFDEVKLSVFNYKQLFSCCRLTMKKSEFNSMFLFVQYHYGESVEDIIKRAKSEECLYKFEQEVLNK